MRSPLSFLCALILGIFLLFPQISRAVIRDGGIDPTNLGNGEWIYILPNAIDNLGLGNISSVTNTSSLMIYLKNQGMQYVIIKSAEGDTLYPSTGSPQFTASVVNAGHAAGLKVFGYNRNRGDNIPGEVAMTDYVFSVGADGFVFDAESEWKAAGYGTLALQLCSTVRSNWPTKFLAHSPFAYRNYHSSFPYKEFGYYCDAVMPQLYWIEFGDTATEAVYTMNSQWRTWHTSLTGSNSTINGFTYRWTNSIKPIVVAGQGWTSTNGTITAPQINEFYKAMKTNSPSASPGGYRGANYWRAELHPSDIWEAVRTNFIANAYTNAPVIQVVPVVTPGSVTASVSWPTDQSSDSVVEYGLTTGYGSSKTNATVLWYHTVNLTGLTADTTYHFRVKSKNATSQQGVSADYVFTTLSATFGDVIVESRQSNGTLTASPLYSDSGFGNSTLKSSASPLSGSTNQGSRFTEVSTASFMVKPTLPVAGGTYDVYATIGSAASVSDDLIVAVGETNCSGLPATTTVFQQAGANTWELIGRTTLSVGVDIPTLAFSRSSGTVASGSRFYSDAIKFVYIPPPASRPSISTQPSAQTVNQGNTATFFVAASGTGPLAYQWKFNGTNIANATTSSYSKNNIQPTNAGNYSVVITNSIGSTNSANAVLTVVQPPFLTSEPPDITTNTGANVVFTVTATGTAPLRYQWQFEAVNISGATNSTLSKTNVQSGDAGNYTVIITNSAGTASASAVLGLYSLVPPQLSLPIFSNNQFHFQFSGGPGNYLIQGSTNFSAWDDLTNFYIESGVLQFTDTQTNLPRRFYRAKLVP